MKNVAAYKYANDIAVEAKAREEVVLNRAVERAVALGLDPIGARSFFAAQITAAKGIQNCWITHWEIGSAAVDEDYPNLVKDIRPELIRIGDEILQEIRQTVPISPESRDSFNMGITVDCLAKQDRNLLFDAYQKCA